MPRSSRSSARWKPGGSFWRIVCSMTRGPAKPMSAPGSARLTSPRRASEAATPPVVGSVISEMNGTPRVRSRASAAPTFAIWRSEKMPSCMRAPPEAETTTRGSRLAAACSMRRVRRSPTPLPMLPPRKAKSNTPSATAWPPIRAVPVTTASFRPVSRRTAASRSAYERRSRKPSGSAAPTSASRSRKEPRSTVIRRRCSRVRRRWWPQRGQTESRRSTSFL